MIRSLTPLALAAVLFSGCAPKLTTFTQPLRERYNWGEEDLKRIQFYLSEDLVLTREFRKGGSAIRNGEVKVIDGRDVEQIVFRKGTPGVYTFSPRDERIAVSFEGGTDTYLIFGPHPKRGGSYTIRGKDWNGDRGFGTITYADKEWRVSTRDAYTSLMIDLKRNRDEDVKGRVAKGQRLK